MPRKLLIVLERKPPHLANARRVQTALESRSYQVFLGDPETLVASARQWAPDFIVIDLPSLSLQYGRLRPQLDCFHRDHDLRKVPVFVISPFVKGPHDSSTRFLGYPALAAPVSPEGLIEFLETERRRRNDRLLLFRFHGTTAFRFDELMVREGFCVFSNKDAESSRFTMAEPKVIEESDWVKIEAICEELDVWDRPSYPSDDSVDAAHYTFLLRIGNRIASGGGPLASDSGRFEGRDSPLYHCLVDIIDQAAVMPFPQTRLAADVVHSAESSGHPLTLVLKNVTNEAVTIQSILMLQKSFSEWKETDDDQPTILREPQIVEPGAILRLPLILRMPNGDEQIVAEAQFKEMMKAPRQIVTVFAPGDWVAHGAMPIRSEVASA